MIKISTITPCYKAEKYLQKFLEEIPKQTVFSEIEIVLDHNEPSDKELELVKKFQKKHPNRLRHIITNPVQPIGTSMNTCINNASGKYLAMWNIDDLRTPDSLNLQYKFLENNKEYGMVHGNFVITKNFGVKYGKYIDHTCYVDDHPVLKTGMPCGPFFMFRKELLKKTGLFDEQLKSGADYDLCMRIARNTKISAVPEVLGYYLDEGKGASTNGDGKQPIERTVIELRYGLHDKINPNYLDEAKKYNIDHVYNNNKKISINNFIQNK